MQASADWRLIPPPATVFAREDAEKRGSSAANPDFFVARP
jgi:hypothetical protein